MKAYVLISIHTGEVNKVVEQIKTVDSVIEANMTFGPYDAVAIVQAEDVNKIGYILTAYIQPIPGVLETLTCLAIEY